MDELEHYITQRSRFYEELDRIRADMNELLAILRSPEASLREVARLAGYHSQKQALFRKFLADEDVLINAYLQSQGWKGKADVPTSSTG